MTSRVVKALLLRLNVVKLGNLDALNSVKLLPSRAVSLRLSDIGRLISLSPAFVILTLIASVSFDISQVDRVAPDMLNTDIFSSGSYVYTFTSTPALVLASNN